MVAFRWPLLFSSGFLGRDFCNEPFTFILTTYKIGSHRNGRKRSHDQRGTEREVTHDKKKLNELLSFLGFHHLNLNLDSVCC